MARWVSLTVVVLLVFCFRLPETNARRPGLPAFARGGRAHLIDRPQGLVGESGPQVDQRHQQPVDEDQPVPRASPGLPPAGTLATFVGDVVVLVEIHTPRAPSHPQLLQ